MCSIADPWPVSHRASETGRHLRAQLGLEVFCVHRGRPAIQRAVRLVIVFRALDAVSLFQPEPPEPLERMFAFAIEQVARKKYQARLIPNRVLVAHRRLRVSSWGMQIEVVKTRISAQADH